MTYTKTPARMAVIHSAMAVNNVLTMDCLEQKTDAELLCFVHPLEREALAKLLGIKYTPKMER